VQGNVGVAAPPPPVLQGAHVAAVAVEAFDVQISSIPPANGQSQSVAVATVAAVEPVEKAEGDDGVDNEEDEGPVYPTDWSGLCNALCKEFPAVSRTDVISTMGRNDNDGKRAAQELRDLLASGEIGGGGAPVDDPEYAASHGL
jgi:hypothetical protein